MESILGFDVFSKRLLRILVSLLFLSASQYGFAQAPEKGPSLFSLKGTWTDQNGNSVQIKDLKGKVSVITMVYTSCNYSCPLLTRKMIAIRKKIDKKDLEKVKFMLVTFDPDRDTVKKLKEYSVSQKLDELNFSLLTSSADTIHTFGMALGFQYKKLGNGDYSHSNIISVLDKNGVLVHQQDVGAETAPMLKIIHDSAEQKFVFDSK